MQSFEGKRRAREPACIHYLTRCFFVPRLKTSTSCLFRAIIGLGAPGAGLAVREGEPEWICDGTEELAAFGLEMMEEMRSDGFDAGCMAVRGGEVEEAFGRGLEAGWGGCEEDAGLLERCLDAGAFSERGGGDDAA